MKYASTIGRVARCLVVVSFLSLGFAMAESEPTLNQIYATAQSGKLADAQVMVQQVLITHPNSAKAHFVQAELYARQGNFARAREALASAEKLAPGLPFAKPEAVQALRSELTAKSAPLAANGSTVHYAVPAAAAPGTTSWGLPLLLAGGVLLLGYFMFRKKAPQPFYPQASYPAPGGMHDAPAYGMGGSPAMPPGYGPAPAGTGLGSRIMGGVATGLAVGAGVMAAEAIGRNLMGNHPSASNNNGLFDSLGDNEPTLNRNLDMGGQNFGVNDAASWDDAGSLDVGGGSDWDT